ncbi:hypothetical protein SAMN03159297_04533 [Pseudomonas sp. NFACC45]|jgi:hypothetical protein|nr:MULTISPECIES: hypothetical protein [Pseudomonas]SFH33600.1 hypothetical protein SAMN03159297_04533 [Pseudomonas sp. NFACC45]
MLATTSKVKPSATLLADSFWMKIWQSGALSIQEAERRALGSQRLKEAYSSVPFYAKKAARDSQFWSKFYASRVNS